MSGIVGIVNFDGAPVDRELLWRMTRRLAPRGPDAQEILAEGNVGFGHALLRTTVESATERQPLTLDGLVWIAADCRVDAREDLIRELAGQGCTVRQGAPDPELILDAYAVWGEECAAHLLGDFSFAIWDGRRRTLFCARDQIGVKPFLFAQVKETLIFSNTLNSVRLHPAVSDRLDELAIADFLMFGMPREPDATSFADIRRLPPAHVLTAGEGPARVKRYWELPEEDELQYRRSGEYVEHFLELLDRATGDRLRTNRVGVLMSGGLDSPTLAATARRLLSATGSPFDLRAHTVVYDRLLPDEERKYSRIAAEGIGIPIHHYPLDDFSFLPDKPTASGYPAEPIVDFSGEASIEIHRGPVAASPVLLTGYGADPLIDSPCFEAMVGKRQYGRLLGGFFWLLWKRRQVPKLGIRGLLRKRVSPVLLRNRAIPTVEPYRSYPDWLQPELVERLGLRERWKTRSLATAAAAEKAPCELVDPYWPYLLEYCDPGGMGLAGELRHPFLDLRLVRYLRRLPPFPWFTEKSLLRVAMRGVLPAPILRRPKTPLAGNQFACQLPPAETSWWERYLAPVPGLENFIDAGVAKATLARVVAAAQAVNDCDDTDLRLCLRPVNLSFWLENNLGTDSPIFTAKSVTE